jgi:hypothetical protein
MYIDLDFLRMDLGSLWDPAVVGLEEDGCDKGAGRAGAGRGFEERGREEYEEVGLRVWRDCMSAVVVHASPFQRLSM